MSAYIVDNFINAGRSTPCNPKIISELINTMDNNLLALYSSIISVKLFFENQYKQMKFICAEIEVDILKKISLYNKDIRMNSEETKKYISVMIDLLQKWVSIRYRMEITVFYFQYGEVIDDELVSYFFQPKLTHTNRRPDKFELLKGHQLFKDEPWNMCSGYGIQNHYKNLSHGFRLLNDKIKNCSSDFTPQLSQKIDDTVCFLIH